MDREHGTEQLGLHGGVPRIVGLDDRRRDEVAGAVVTHAPADHVGVAVDPCGVDVALLLVERGLVDDRPHEVGEVGHVPVGDRLHLGDDLVPAPVPQALGNIGAAGRAALLPLVLVGPPDEVGGELVGVGRAWAKTKSLPPVSPTMRGIAPVPGDVAPDGPPHALEHLGAAGEVHAAEVGVGHGGTADLPARARHEVDDPRGQAGLFEQLHQPVGREHRGGRRLPDDVLPINAGLVGRLRRWP